MYSTLKATYYLFVVLLLTSCGGDDPCYYVGKGEDIAIRHSFIQMMDNEVPHMELEIIYDKIPVASADYKWEINGQLSQKKTMNYQGDGQLDGFIKIVNQEDDCFIYKGISEYYDFYAACDYLGGSEFIEISELDRKENQEETTITLAAKYKGPENMSLEFQWEIEGSTYDSNEIVLNHFDLTFPLATILYCQDFYFCGMKNYTALLLLATLFFACKPDQPKTTKTMEPSKPEVTKPKESAPPKVMSEATLDLTKYGVANDGRNVLGGLKVGDIAPTFAAKSNRGKVIDLTEETEHSTVILVFFRGTWCPYCTKHLSELQDHFKEIVGAGKARIIAVTPESMPEVRKKANDLGLFYHVISDTDHKIMNDYKVLFHVTDDYDDKIVKYKGKSLATINGDQDAVLTVPATYVIGSNMRVKYAYYDADYSKRPDIKELMAVLD